MQRMIGALAILGLAAAPAMAQTRSTTRPTQVQKQIDPRADQALHRMSDYLGGLKSFQVRAATVDEVVLTSGQHLQFMTDSIVMVKRPDRLRSERVGAHDMAFFDDGRTLSLYCKGQNSYSSIPAAQGLDAAIDQARAYGLDAPGADLLAARPYDVLTDDVTTGDYIGVETVDGVPCHHLAFRGDETDWQIWIQDGPQPLPLRYSILSKKVTGQPQFTVRMSQWQPAANLPDNMFTFQPPAGATRTEQFPQDCAGPIQAPKQQPAQNPEDKKTKE